MNRKLVLLSVLGGIALYGYVHASEISKAHDISSVPEAQEQTRGVAPSMDALSDDDQKPADSNDAAHKVVAPISDGVTHTDTLSGADTATSDDQKPALPQASADDSAPKVPAVTQ